MNEQTREKTGRENEEAQAPESESGASPEEAPPSATEEREAKEPQAEPTPEEQIAEMKDRLLRAIAEAENVRRRAEREKAEAQKFGISRFARDLLSVADNLRRAIDAVPAEQREGLDEVSRNLIAGVEMVERELLSTFERHGITSLVPEKGTKFDPNLHQAMAEVPDPDAPPGTVSDVFQTGYVIGDRLLRPAMVTIARAETARPEDSETAEDDKDDDARTGSGG